MTVAAAGPPQPSRRPFAEATPAQIRDALGDHEAAEFDDQWRSAMDRARDRLDLSGMYDVLEAFRRIAWLVSELGTRGPRDMISSAEERARTGERASGSVPWNQLEVELGVQAEAQGGDCRGRLQPAAGRATRGPVTAAGGSGAAGLVRRVWRSRVAAACSRAKRSRAAGALPAQR